MKQGVISYLSEIGLNSILVLMLAGFLFGIAFTYSHFWAIKKYVLNGGAFQKKIFLLTFVRLIVFAGALFIAAYPNYPAVRMIIFFITLMIGRKMMMFMAKREISK
jgi:hypothetical protein